MIKTVIIALFVLMNIFEEIVDFLNNSNIKKDLPENVRDVYDAKEYEKFVNYKKMNVKVDMYEKIISVTIQLALLVFNVYAWIFNSLANMNIYLQYLVFITLATVVLEPVSIAFSYYRTFVIEERFEMNKTTKKTFVIDTIKNFFITIMISSLIMGIIVFFFEKFGIRGTIYIIGVVIAISLLLAVIVIPLMRIFNKFDPLEEGELKDKLLALCDKYGVKVKKIVIKDASRRTTKANAFCTGLKKKTISLDDNLVNNYSSDEIVAVFAHEFAHAKYKHVLKSIPFSALTIIVTVTALGILLTFDTIFLAFGFTSINYYFAQLILEIITWPFSVLVNLIGNYLSRKHEYEADAFAAKEGYGKDLISSLKKLNKDSLSNINPHPLTVALYYSHPTLSQRIEAIEACER